MSVRAAVVAVAATVLAACTPAPVSAPQRAVASPDVVPGVVTATVSPAQLGRGSVLAVVRRAGSDDIDAVPLAVSLEVITPDGERHPVWSTALAELDDTYPGEFWLADWRPDLHTALLRIRRGRTVPDRVVAYDLTTGAMQSLVLPGRATSAGLAPDGTGVLVALYGTGPAGRLVRQTWSGERVRLPGSTGGAPLLSADGRTLVSPAGDVADWWVIDLTTDAARRLTPPGTCDPIRWLDDEHVLASCFARGGNTLTSVGLDGASTALGVLHRVVGAGRAQYLSDGDVRTLAGRRLFLTWRECASGVLTQVSSSGRPVRVRRSGGVDDLVGIRGRRLLLAMGSDPCRATPPREVLALLDPVTGVRTIRTRLARDEHWRTVIGATEVRHWDP